MVNISFVVEEPHFGDPKHTCHIPKLGEQVPYMLTVLHPEEMDKDFVSGKPIVLFALVHVLVICVFHLKSCVIVNPHFRGPYSQKCKKPQSYLFFS